MKTRKVPQAPAMILLLAGSLGGDAHAGGPVPMGNHSMAGGNALFIIPPDPHTADSIAISYPRRGCGAERVDTTTKGKDIEITVTFDQTCLYAITPGFQQPNIPTPGSLYGRIELGHLPAGNYRVRLYYRDLSESAESRSFATTELFSVMPSR